MAEAKRMKVNVNILIVKGAKIHAILSSGALPLSV